MAEKKNPAEGEPKKSGGKKIILFGVVTLILVAGGAAAGYLLGAKSTPKGKSQTASTAGKAKSGEDSKAAPAKDGLGPMVNIDPFIVNILADQGTRYLKAAITLEAQNKATAAEITARMPEIKDAILLLIGNKTYRELSDLQGKMQLRIELVNRLNKILHQGKIKAIYFTDFVIQ
jgi:flagellar FliL protein